MTDENRQERVDKLAVPENFSVSVAYRGSPSFVGRAPGLTAEEDTRLRTKLDLVEQVAAKLAANMLKGTLKYDNDEYTVREWLLMGQDDAADAVNYMTLALARLDEVR